MKGDRLMILLETILVAIVLWMIVNLIGAIFVKVGAESARTLYKPFWSLALWILGEKQTTCEAKKETKSKKKGYDL